MDFEEILKLRQDYPIYSGGKDALLDAILDGTYKHDYALLTMSIISKNTQELLKNRYIDMIIQIPSPFNWVGINFIIIHFKNSKPDKLLTGIFKGKVCKNNHNKKPPCDGKWYTFEEKTEDFNNYIECINSFLENKTINRTDLTINDFSVFDMNNLNPLYYTEQAVKVRNELQESDYKLLRDISEIISIPTDKNIEAKYIDSKNFKYDLDYDELPTGKISRAIKLIKGDIIVLLVGEQPKFYLYNKDFKDVYIKAGNYCVIRVKEKKITNYIVNYLNDEKARMYFATTKKGIYIPVLKKGDLGELKVIIPTQEMINNADLFMEYTMNPQKLSTDNINQLLRNACDIDYKNESQKMIDEDILSAISKMKNEVIREIISDDLKEVEICFNHKAYKSAVILCGSILEAVLLDWISIYENTEDILEAARGEDGRDLELSKIIYKLKEVVKPYWYEASKANKIRKTRNMVHPKECIRNNIKITSEECKEIIDDLNDIIESKENRS